MADYLDFISSGLQAAAEIVKNGFGKVISATKSGDNNQVLTETDLQIGQMLISLIGAEFPNHNIIDEEAGGIDHDSEYTWVIDPVDGTSNFAAGLPTYGVMLGLLEGGQPLAGGVVLPAFSEIYLARKGQGASCNGRKITVTGEEKLQNVLLAFGIDIHGFRPDETRKDFQLLAEIALLVRNVRSTNSCFDIMHVASGAYGAWLGTDSKIWDNVAPQIIIEEAGGLYTDLLGQTLDYSQPLNKMGQNFTFCAASPALHMQIQKVIQGFFKTNETRF